MDTTANLLQKASAEVETDGSWENVRNALMANIKIVEGLLYVDPHNEMLLAAVAKGYAGYAFMADETLYLDDLLTDNAHQYHRDQAIFNFSKALRYSLRFLEEKGVTYRDLGAATQKKEGMAQLLDGKLDDDRLNREAVFFMAQSMMSLINLQKDKMILVAQLPIAKGLLDWVCERDPSINYGSCPLFYGAYYASRPKVLGGNFQKARENFEMAIRQNPHNWLARVLYIQYYLIPRGDREEYGRQKALMEKFSGQFDHLRRWLPYRDVHQLGEKRLRLYQAIALKRYQIIKKNEKELF